MFCNPVAFWKTRNALPKGAIIPFLGSTIPAGWARWALGDGRMVVGAGGAHSVGEFGGSATHDATLATASGGAHSGGATFYGSKGGPYVLGAPDLWTGTTGDGAHAHTIGAQFIGVQDVYRDYMLIKSQGLTTRIPKDGCAMAATALGLSTASLVDQAVDRFLRSAAVSGGQGGSATHFEAGALTSSDGAHRHGGTRTKRDDSGVGFESWIQNETGNHSHAIDITMTLNTRRRYLTLWSNAANDWAIESGVIVMWEGATIPSGWALCDGTGGTPDMRDYHVRIGSEAQATGGGAAAGDNVASFTGTTSLAGAHEHQGSLNYDYTQDTTRHGSSEGNHQHTLNDTETVRPLWYALAFLMRL